MFGVPLLQDGLQAFSVGLSVGDSSIPFSFYPNPGWLREVGGQSVNLT